MRDREHPAESQHGRQAALDPQEAAADLLRRFERPGSSYWVAAVILALLLIAGIAGLILRLSAKLPNTPAWGYYAATFGYLLTTVMAVPIVAIGLHFTKAVWPRPLNRAAMLFSVPGVLWGLMFLPLLGVLPPNRGRATIWFNAPDATMRWVDTIAVWSLVLLGLAIMFLRGRPDWALIRDRSGGRGWASGLAGVWHGSQHQWDILQTALSLLGAAYLFLYAYVTLLITSDFDMSLMPGWRSAIYATYHVVTSLQAGIATLLVTLALLRGAGGLRRYLGIDQFWSLGKLQLAFTLLWFYFFWSEFIVIWYGRTPREQSLLQTFEFGPYFTPFLLTVIFAFFIPFALLIWNPIRKSIAGPTIAAASILIGLFFDRIRLYVPAYTTAGVGNPTLGQVPPVHLPDIADWLVMVGALGGCAMLFLVAMRLLPAISIWEIKVYLMMRQTRRFLRTVVEVVGKAT